METLFIGLLMLCALLFFLGLGLWVFASLFLVGILSLYFLLGMSAERIGVIGAITIFRFSTAWELAAIPMFIWMGEIILRTDIANRLFKGLVPIVNILPGRLLHSNLLGCALFAAVSGSSAATTATVGKITMTELRQRNYDNNLMIGSLAGAGTLGLLIPPSIVMIIYGVQAEVSIPHLFAAGLLPGLVVVSVYSIYIGIRCMGKGGTKAPPSIDRISSQDLVPAIQNLLPVSILILIVLGSIYSGVATPSEAAAIGVASALGLVLAMGQLTMRVVRDSLMAALRTSCMIGILLVSASFLATAMGFLQIPVNLAAQISEMNLSPLQLILVLSLFYLVLGLFLEGVSILVMTLPLTLPLVTAAGFDPIWFGIYLILMIELALVTPPIGFNLFVIQGLTGDPIGRVAIAAFPFFLLMCLVVVLITAFPSIALWLPAVLYDL